MIEVAFVLAGGPLLIGGLIWLLRYCLRVGAVGTWNAGDVRRAEKPIAFWINIVGLAGSVVMMVCGFIFAVWKMFLE